MGSLIILTILLTPVIFGLLAFYETGKEAIQDLGVRK